MTDSKYYTADIVVNSRPSLRKNFIRNTYLNLAFSVLAFLGLIITTYQMNFFPIFNSLLYSTRYGIYILLGGSVLLSILANNLAIKTKNIFLQYLSLILYILLEILVFIPIISLALTISPDILIYAVVLTLTLFFGITFIAFLNQADFSFLKSFLNLTGIIAISAITLGIFVGFSLGLWFSVLMIIFAGFSILYETSNVIYKYQTDQSVAASLALFSSVSMMFFYILRFLVQFSNRN
jgi:FtsH-binding integral membrane protein